MIVHARKIVEKLVYRLQFDEYKTDPYFLQLSQNMATNCLFTFVFPRSYLNLPVLREG
jgi:hypothetical protein